MTESRKTEQENSEKRVLSFGEHLYVERKRQNLTVEDVAEAIHLSENVIDAIERSDITQLPQHAFVQGYLRAYAKYLGISEALVLEEYAHAVPHKQEADLQPRSTLPDEASSNTPFVKLITLALLVMTVVAALYASFSYYKNAIVSDEIEQNNQTSLSLPESVSMEQDEAERELLLDVPEQVEAEQAAPELTGEVQDVPVKEVVETVESSESIVSESEPEPAAQENIENKRVINQQVAEGEDVLELSAEQVSWVEVEDANGVNLYYDLLQQAQTVSLQGTAPFKIFLGNAPEVKVIINELSVNIENHIRSNNIAHFSVSVDQQQVVFH